MDPFRTLLDADDAIRDDDFDKAIELLQDYRGWRKRGGFEPLNMPSDVFPRGDAFAAGLVRRLEQEMT